MALLPTGAMTIWRLINVLRFHIGKIVSATGDKKKNTMNLKSLTPRLYRSHEAKWTEWTLQPRVHQVSDSLQGKISTAS